jgi:hypothetical protein
MLFSKKIGIFTKRLFLIFLVIVTVLSQPGGPISAQQFKGATDLERQRAYTNTLYSIFDSGCGTNTSSSSGVNPGKLFAIGDSLLVGMDSLGKLGDNFNTDGWSYSANANEGRSITRSGSGKQNTGSATEVINSSSDVGSASVILVVLGTNQSSDEEIKNFYNLIKQKNANAQVFWLSVYQDSVPHAQQSNAAIAQSGAKVITNNVKPDGGDGIHYTASGYKNLATIITDGVKSATNTAEPSASTSPSSSNSPTDSGYSGGSGQSISNVNLSAYSPQGADGPGNSSVEGGLATSTPGLDSAAIARTLDDVEAALAGTPPSGGAADQISKYMSKPYLTLAGNSSNYKKAYLIPSISWKNKNGEAKTLTNVLAYVHDTGSAFKTAPEGRYDVAVGINYTDSAINSGQPFHGASNPGGVQLIPVDPETLKYSHSSASNSDPCICPADSSGQYANSSNLSSNIPEPWRGIISDAASKKPDGDPNLVAALLWTENRGWPDINKKWSTSSANAQGPWQFIPSTWKSLGEDGDGDGIKDPNNPKDAVLAAFNHNKKSKGKPIVEGFSGDVENGLDLIFKRDKNTLLGYAAAYNGNGSVSGVSIRNQPKRENGDYVQLVYVVLASDFTKKWDNDKSVITDIGSGSSVTANNQNQGTNCYQNQDTAQSDISGGYGELQEYILKAPNLSLSSAAEGDIKRGYGSSPSPCSESKVNINTLRLIKALLVQFPDQKFAIHTIISGHHCNAGFHPKGLGVDLNTQGDTGSTCENKNGAERMMADVVMPFVFNNKDKLNINEMFYNADDLLKFTLNEGTTYNKKVSGHCDHIHLGVNPGQ